jgi:hypothetical protein
VVTAASGGIGVGNVIAGQASDGGADLVVMGGYGHSRLRELVLGGATQSHARPHAGSGAAVALAAATAETLPVAAS